MMTERVDISDLVDVNSVIEVEKVDIEDLKGRYSYLVVKRLFDIFASAIALIVFAIPMIVISIAIKLDSPGPILYKQERLGKNGKPFQLVKFRSMRVDAEKNGVQWASKQDTRVTRVGYYIRACRLDEVPQFWGVIIGDLSIVGPRPERSVYYDAFEKYIHGFNQRLLVTPGLTGLAQVNGGYDLKPSEKIIYDIEYIKKQSFWLDIKIIFKTIIVVLLGRKGGGR